MHDYDTLITNGNVVLKDSVQPLNLGIKDGYIKDIGKSLQGTALHEYNAEGLYVFPGSIDVHVHFNEPGREDWEGFDSGSAMMAAGGCTTYFDMPLNGIPSTTDQSALSKKAQIGQEKSFVDFGLWGGLVPGNEDELAGLSRQGVVGFKAFMSPSGNKEFESADDETLLRGMRKITKLGKVLALHAESTPIVELLQQESAEQGVSGPDDYAASRPVEAEIEAVQRALSFAKVTGCPLHFVHISSAETIDIIDKAKQEGVDVTVETCAHYLLFNHNALQEEGAVAKCAPPLRSEKERQALVQSLLDGKIDMVSSDHSPCTPDLKETDDMFRAWGGINGGQFTLMALLDIASQYDHSFTEVAGWSADFPSQRFQLESEKGSIEKGKFADLALIDVNQTHVITTDDLFTKHSQSLYEGHSFPCKVISTFHRGNLVYHYKMGVSANASGEWIHDYSHRS
ncbi:allantoinase AllB [Salibacterium salarium]|uniref:Allantoinase n=1 Tax=Salibacterium salarium TaxID=284579 RepID=A0A3R9RCQ1_9BACI|nr:allantoinase AllB [Salibacterium salarium]RSL32421.1 allantoinase AllB [Salibacterium salarium]